MKKNIKRYSQNKNSIRELAQILKNDGVIAVPTDTVYGVCSRMDSKNAHDKLEDLKERIPGKLLSIMCTDINQVKKFAIVNEKVEKIINNFMPGPITVILKKVNNFPEYINKGSYEIGIRMATSKELEDLINEIGCPLLMTSANKSGKPVCRTVEEIEKELPNVDAILEGETSYGKASTIVCCLDLDNIFIKREGPISEEEIMKVIEE